MTAPLPRTLRRPPLDVPRAPTLEEVAKQAGVSRSTASRAINGGLKVSPSAQTAVDAAIARLGYTPNRAARTLVTRRTDSVALVVPEPDERVLTDPYFAGSLQGISAALEPTNIQLVLLIARRGEGSQRTAHYLLNRHVDGAVVVSHHRDDALNRVLVDSHLPCVFVGRPWNVTGDMTYVDLDNSAGGAAATERLLAAYPDVDGIFAASDLMAAGALGVLTRAGHSVPGDVRVVGFDDLGVATTTAPPLTTMRNPVVEMSRAAGELLLALLAGSAAHLDHRVAHR